MEIILYAGGAAGDLVSAMIDDRGYHFVNSHLVNFDLNRTFLRNKKCLDTMTHMERDKKLKESTFLSIPSHLFGFHIEYKHDFILIDSAELKVANYAIERFNKIYPSRNIGIQTHLDICNLSRPYTNKIINFKDILEGKLIEKLKKIVTTPLNENLYYRWLEKNYTLL